MMIRRRRPWNLKVGQAVRHPTLGLGKILELSKTGTNTRAIVEFRRSGQKTLILEYARTAGAGLEISAKLRDVVALCECGILGGDIRGG